MKKWIEFEKEICNWLQGYEKNPRIEFRNSYQSIIGFPSQGPRSDGMLKIGDVLIAVEIEAGQTHPDTNIGKYWLLQCEYKYYEKIILFHIYTPRFNSYGWRKTLGEFYFTKMKDDIPINYQLIDIKKESDFDKAVENVKKLIRKEIRKVLNQ